MRPVPTTPTVAEEMSRPILPRSSKSWATAARAMNLTLRAAIIISMIV